MREVGRTRIRIGDDAYHAEQRRYNGGTHLPDVTVITPVFDAATEREIHVLLSASRGHHADIGGKTPGSAPHRTAEHIEEEGVVIDNFKLVERGSDSGLTQKPGLCLKLGQISVPQHRSQHRRPRSTGCRERNRRARSTKR